MKFTRRLPSFDCMFSNLCWVWELVLEIKVIWFDKGQCTLEFRPFYMQFNMIPKNLTHSSMKIFMRCDWFWMSNRGGHQKDSKKRRHIFTAPMRMRVFDNDLCTYVCRHKFPLFLPIPLETWRFIYIHVRSSLSHIRIRHLSPDL